jgi:hypothetical protein
MVAFPSEAMPPQSASPVFLPDYIHESQYAARRSPSQIAPRGRVNARAVCQPLCICLLPGAFDVLAG